MRTLTVSLYFIHVGLQAQFIMGRNKECFVCSCVAAISQSLGVFAPARTPSSHTQLRRGGSSPTRSCYKNHQHTTAADAAERDAAELSLLFLFFGKGALLLSVSLSLSLSVKGFNSLRAWPCSLRVFFSLPPPPSCAVVLNSGVKKPWGRAAIWTMTGVCVLSLDLFL